MFTVTGGIGVKMAFRPGYGNGRILRRDTTGNQTEKAVSPLSGQIREHIIERTIPGGFPLQLNDGCMFGTRTQCHSL